MHIAIIMDGNGRWAQRRRRSRSYGHRQGERSVRSVVEASPSLGIRTLTLYAFSSDNWERPAPEVRSLLHLLKRYLIGEIPNCVRNGVRLNVIGRRDRLPPYVCRAIRRCESATGNGCTLHLRIAVDYSARDAIVGASKMAGPGDTRSTFQTNLNRVIHSDPPAPPVDLLIRTGGEQRLSDFLLWECAYAEFLFSRVLWPDYRSEHLERAVRIFLSRHRRFGKIDLSGRPHSQRSSSGESPYVSTAS